MNNKAHMTMSNVHHHLQIRNTEWRSSNLGLVPTTEAVMEWEIHDSGSNLHRMLSKDPIVYWWKETFGTRRMPWKSAWSEQFVLLLPLLRNIALSASTCQGLMLDLAIISSCCAIGTYFVVKFLYMKTLSLSLSRRSKCLIIGVFLIASTWRFINSCWHFVD